MIRAKWLVAFVFIATPQFTHGQSPADTQKAENTDRETRIVQEHGDVFIKPSGQKDYVPALVDTPLETGDTVQTGAEGDCDISMDGNSLLHVEKGTELNLASLDQRDSIFTVSVGGLLGKLVGSKNQPANMEFKTPTAWGGLRGTEIGIETTEHESRFGVFDEGKLAVHRDGAEVLLTPHMELAASANEPLGPAREMKALLGYQQHMEQVRKTREMTEKTWKSMDPNQRQAHRQRLLAQKTVPASKVAEQVRKAQSRMEKKFKHESREQRSSQRRRDSRRR